MVLSLFFCSNAQACEPRENWTEKRGSSKGGRVLGQVEGTFVAACVGDHFFLPSSADWSLPRADGSMSFPDGESDSNK